MRLRHAPATAALLAVIAAVFLLELARGAGRSDLVLYDMGALTADTFRRHEYWRLLAAMFLHAGWTHVLLNLFSLFQVGAAFETLFGSRRMLFVYFVSGLCVSLGTPFRMPPNGISLGASGAIFGLVGALILTVLRTRYRHERWARVMVLQLVICVVLNFAFAMDFQEIDNVAHMIGFAVGLLLGLIPAHVAPPPPPSTEMVDVTPESQ
ncbi:MAG: rhomboid family intramembrane serine protease [Acidobacteria bacterium]|nr:rhomboid family intramembrane serine protease [Acidobacteriota bacterium]